jgi:mRNA-degrading endonuclease RelE of RelBE toxin-antitoxin system
MKKLCKKFRKWLKKLLKKRPDRPGELAIQVEEIER